MVSPVSPARRRLIQAAAGVCLVPAGARASNDPAAVLRAIFEPVAEQYGVPGMVAGLQLRGQRYFFEHGVVASGQAARADRNTLFELGSISKCFTATLGALSQVRGKLSLSTPVEDIEPALRGSPLGRATLLHCATYTAGGLPLQFPSEIASDADALRYFKSFQPSAAPGEIRQYSNPSIGLLGHAIAKASGRPFIELAERELFAALNLNSTFIRVPASEMRRYAWGHDAAGRHIRVNPGVFDAEAYGVKSTASDMLDFVAANLRPATLATELRRSVEATHVPYFRAAPMLQGLGWEQYAWPTTEQHLLEGNGARIVMQPNAVQRTDARQPSTARTLFNKTGSTGGFGAYALFVPDLELGFVMLANRNFPVAARVSAARSVLGALT
jgi:beta-lactamase class C